MIGFVCVDKRVGDTSAYVVNRIKKLVKKPCGHMGTLDPLASGVLPVAIGQATRLFPYLVEKKKTYVADFDFSFSTPSLDLETEVVARTETRVTEDDVKKVLPLFVGNILQVPPVYSAKCVDGKRSYKLARRGVEVELKPKEITVYSIELSERLSETSFRFEITCGGGTYIRSIVRDLGSAMGVLGTMTALRRTSSGVFNLDDSVTLQDLDDISAHIIPPEKTLFFPELKLDALGEKRLLNGLYDDYAYENGLYKVFGESGFLGVGEILDEKLKMKAYVRDL